MKPKEAAHILRLHNKWRRGEQDEDGNEWPQQSPRLIGQAIDCLCDMAEEKYIHGGVNAD